MHKEVSIFKLLRFNDNDYISLSNILFVLLASLFSFLILNLSVGMTETANLFLFFIIGIFSLIYLFLKPKYWIYSILLFTAAFSSTTGGGISVIDIVFSVYFNVFLFIWLLWAVFVKKYKLIETRIEWIMVAFYVLISLTVINYWFDNINLLSWSREYILLTLSLIYFPLKKYITTKKEIISISVVFLITLVVADIVQFYLYKQILSDITYAYQAGSTIRNNLYLFVVGSTFSCLFLFYQKKFIYRLLLAAILILSLGALASTFARIFWASAFINIFLIFIILNNREKIRFITYTVVSLFIAYIVSSLLFGNIFEFVLYALESRLESTSKGTTDISALSRFAEWEVVIDKIKSSPFVGNGFGYEFTFKNPIASFMTYTSIIHNSFLHFAYRIGIPLTIMYFTVFFYFFYKAIFYTTRIKKDLFYKILMIGTTLCFITMVITGMFTMTFILRDALIINAVLYFFISYTDKNYLAHKIN